MAGDWQSFRLAEVATTTDYVANGSFESLRKNVTYRSSPDHAVLVRLMDYKAGWKGDFVYVDKASYQFLKKSALFPGDIVIANVGANAGTVFRVPDLGTRMTLGPNAVLCRPKEESILQRDFLYYYLISDRGQHALQTIRSGSAQPKFNKTDLRSLLVPIPPMAEQHAISHLLGTLDARIELSHRMNETLEAITRALFRSWFVDFDPVHANAQGRVPRLPQHLGNLFPHGFEESELGDKPAGWRVGQVADVLAELVSGSRPRGGAIGEGVPSIGAENVLGLGRYDFSKEKFIPRGFFEQLKRRGAAVRFGDVLLYKDGAQIGRKTYFDCAFPHLECAINEHVFILRATRRQEQRYLFFWLDQDWMTNQIVGLNSNSAQPGINQAGVRRLPLLVPPQDVVDAFDRLVRPLTERLFANCIHSRTLASLRNTVLPKLIAGDLRVPVVERMHQAAKS